MKKIVFLLAIVMCACFLHAGFGFSVGYYGPVDPDGGVIWGLETVRVIDERVDLVFSADFFTRSFNKGMKYTIKEHDGTTHPATARSYVTTTYIPTLVHAKIKIVDIDLGSVVLQPFAGGGLGWGMAWESVKSLENNIYPYDDWSYYNGFAWQLNAGVQLPLGTNSNLYSKVFYNGSKFTKDIDVTQEGVSWSELNMSGVGISLGIRLQY